jgi:uncharacterized protein (DUF1015 family)
MAIFKPFKAFRPKTEFAYEVAAKPYDVLNSDEARIEVKDKPNSFLHVGKPEVDLDPSINIYDSAVYNKGKENLDSLINRGILFQDQDAYFYLYAQTMNGRTQYGLVGCCSIEDYWNDVIKKHEHTRKTKEEDRCQHVRVTNAHTGPIFLTYPDKQEIDNIVEMVKFQNPDVDIMSDDGINHRTWAIKDAETIEVIENLFGEIPNLYVADGHHRSAAAAIVGRERKEANPHHNGTEEYNLFLSVLFPASQLYIMDYNRVVKDLNNYDYDVFVRLVSKNFNVIRSGGMVKPLQKGEFGMYLANKEWYVLVAKEEFIYNPDPVQSLDVSILQNNLFDEILDIKDPRTDDRIDFVGGIRGIEELVRRVDSGEMMAAFVLYPTSINELMKIADSGEVMPPKSTWFEPKLRDGLFVHFLD